MTRFSMNPMLLTDFYKLSHVAQYPKGAQKVYSTFTARTSRIPGINKVVFFGLQGFIKEYLIDYFNKLFFEEPLDEVLNDYIRVVKNTLGIEKPETSHIENLHKLGHLPIKICAVKEGSTIPIRVPVFTIENTSDEYFWVTNFLETFMSANIWKPITTATITKDYRNICDKWAEKTADNNGYVDFQCHNFSMRGMSGFDDLVTTGAAHLLSFVGTDTIPAIIYHEDYYNANIEKELVGCSIPASEHSVQCAYHDDKKYFDEMITRIYPNGFVSIVSDGYDYWSMLTDVIPSLKEKIMARDGRVVVRPDSGDPVEIICGLDNIENREDLTPEQKGSIEVLWEIFGGTINSKGYKVLDSHIGLIYGDAITPERANEILRRLEKKGFSAENVVFGVGSYSLGFHTRDTFGMALKTTYFKSNNEEQLIFKDPKTDNGIKKSQKGLVVVVKDGEEIKFVDTLYEKEKESYKDKDLLEVVFENGKLLRNQTLSEIRQIVKNN